MLTRLPLWLTSAFRAGIKQAGEARRQAGCKPRGGAPRVVQGAPVRGQRERERVRPVAGRGAHARRVRRRYLRAADP